MDGMSLKDEKRRMGKMLISASLYRHNVPALRQIFAQLIPLRAEMLLHEDAVEVYALCEAFDLVGIYHPPPEYVATVTEHPAGPPTVEWRKAEAGEVTKA